MNRQAFAKFGLGLPETPTLDDFIHAVAVREGKPVKVRPAQHMRGNAPSGLVIPLRSLILIGHAPVASVVARSFIVGHELGHVVLQHVGTPCHEAGTKTYACRAMARGLSDDPDENEAEDFSYMMNSLIYRRKIENIGFEGMLHP